jgi:hypothetical protein
MNMTSPSGTIHLHVELSGNYTLTLSIRAITGGSEGRGQWASGNPQSGGGNPGSTIIGGQTFQINFPAPYTTSDSFGPIIPRWANEQLNVGLDKHDPEITVASPSRGTITVAFRTSGHSKIADFDVLWEVS